MYSIGLRSGHHHAHLEDVQAGAKAIICYTTCILVLNDIELTEISQRY